MFFIEPLYEYLLGSRISSLYGGKSANPSILLGHGNVYWIDRQEIHMKYYYCECCGVRLF
uniref:Secreted protein n=1 Tax=Parascaris univalens TaxID=6257 RepID=A0A915BDN2_PARUN